MSTRTRRRRTPARDLQAPKRVVIVTRLSKDPGDGAVNHGTQEAGCRRKAEAEGMTVVAVFRDDISGDRLDRPGLSQARAMIEAGEVEVLLTYATDRLSRDQVDVAVIVHQVRRAGGDVLSATEDLAAGPLGDFMRGTYAFAAQMELVKNRERTNRGLGARFAAQGKYKPGPRPPYGYRKEGTGGDATYHEHPAQAAVVRRIFAETAQGRSRRAVAKGLNAEGVPTASGKPWDPALITRIIGRDTYWTGEHECWRTRTARDADNVPYAEIRPADERYRVGGFPVLVDAETAQRAKAAAARNRWATRRADRDPKTALLRYGFAVCGGCGQRLAVDTNRAGHVSYRCATVRTNWRCRAQACIAVDKLDGPVWDWVLVVLQDPSQAGRYVYARPPAASVPDTVSALAAAEARVADLTAQADGLIANLALLSGPAARLAADRANGLNADLTAATAERDGLAAEIARARRPASPTVIPADAMARAGAAAIRAMLDAEPADPATVTRPVPGAGPLRPPEGAIVLRAPYAPGEYLPASLRAQHAARGTEPAVELALALPDTWKARRAALSVLNVEVRVNQAGAAAPRWEAVMRPGDGQLPGRDDGAGGYMVPTR